MGASPGAGRTAPPDIAAQIDEVVAQVPALRELEPLRDVPYVILNRAEFQSELEQILDAEVDPVELATEGRLLVRLGLLPPDTDLYELLRELYGTQIAAYYRTDTRTFYVIERDEPFGPLDRLIVAHEYTHALQDQHFDLEGTRVTDPSQGDAVLAQLAAVEGDATLLMFRWAFAHLDIREQLELIVGSIPTPTDQATLESMPPILRRQLEFPYNDGFVFSSELEARGGWAAINETLRRPPASTEQVLHPQKYLDDERPLAVEPPDMAAALGDGWQLSYRQTLGELNIGVWLADGEPAPMPFVPAPPRPWQSAAAGWGGDRLHMYEHDDGRWAIVWQTAWDSPDDAAEFEPMAADLLSRLDESTFIEAHGGSPPMVTMLLASDAVTLLSMRGAAFP